MRLYSLVLSLIATSALPAQQPKALKEPPQPATGRLTGTITLSDTHAPARGATVFIRLLKTTEDFTAGSHTTTTDINGHFLFPRLPAGEYAVEPSLTGYISELNRAYEALPTPPSDLASTNAFLEAFGSITVRPNATTNADQVLDRGAVLSGRILYADGSPVIHATVRVETQKRAKGLALQPMGVFSNLHTDDRGMYREAGLTHGSYCVVVIPPRQDSPSAGPENSPFASSSASSLRYYSGNAFHLASAKFYDLEEGQETAADDILIPLGTLRSVAGSVTALDGRTINMGKLTLSDSSDETLVFNANLADDGSFSFGNVPPGTYTLKLDAAAIGTPNVHAAKAWERDDLVASEWFHNASQTVVVNDSGLSGVNFALTPDPGHKQEPAKQDEYLP